LELGVTVQRVVVSSLADETFHATLELELNGRVYAIDARPSDALALAVRTGVRIYASTEVLDRAGVEPEMQVDQKLEVFREFINSLDVDLEEGHREGPGSSEPPLE
jgi:bifunctional DNase/RNase